MAHNSSLECAVETFLRDVVSGLKREQKTLPCKYFYDEAGSQLFDQICELDEYYLTRTEFSIMELHADSMAEQIGERVMLVELGSGSSTKTRVLLDALRHPTAYAPVDISEEHLLKTAEELRIAFPDIEILPVVADFTKDFDLPQSKKPASHAAVYFPGSTIGNFTEAGAANLLGTMARILGVGGGVLIGIDLQKDATIIQKAYDDSAGVTAEFNLNILRRINDELDGDFDLDAFNHRAVYNSDVGRVEISLESTSDQVVKIGEQEIDFSVGEHILTEYSHKYTVDEFARLAASQGFELHKHWTDSREYFAVLHLVLESL